MAFYTKYKRQPWPHTLFLPITSAVPAQPSPKGKAFFGDFHFSSATVTPSSPSPKRPGRKALT